MVRRLYLTDRGRYRVRMLDATVRRCIWRDDLLAFELGRGDERHAIDLDHVAAVSVFEADGRARPYWVPFESCYRAIHAPRAKGRPWVHPYATTREHAA